MKRFVWFFALIFLLAWCSSVLAADLVCDFDGNSKIDDSDLLILLAYLQVKGLSKIGLQTLDIPTVQAKARLLLNNSALVVTRLPLPADILEDTNSTEVSDNDLMILLAYLQTKGLSEIGLQTLDFPTVQAKAILLLNRTVALSKFPQIQIGDSTVPVTITGIQVDP